MANNTGTAVWQGGLKEGKGNVSTQSGILDSAYSFGTRFAEETNGTNPEELVGAAHAACYAMFLSSLLEKAGTPTTRLRAEAKVLLGQDETGPYIRKIDLIAEAEVANISEEEFQKLAQEAKAGCPISRALASVPEINLTATLKA